MPKVPLRKRQKHVKKHYGTSKGLPGKTEGKQDDLSSDDYSIHPPLPDSSEELTSPPVSPDFVASTSVCSQPGSSKDGFVSHSLSPSPVKSSLCESDHLRTVAETSSPSPLPTSSSQYSPEFQTQPNNPATIEVEALNSLLLKVREKISLFLPKHWNPVVDGSGLYILMLSQGSLKAVQRSVFIHHDGSVRVDIHCKSVPTSPFTHSAMPPKSLTEETVGHFVDRAVQIVYNVRMQEICSGCDFEEYKSVWNVCEHGEVDKNPYQELRYCETFRSFKCSRLVSASRWRCFECSRLQIYLKRRLQSQSESSHHPYTPNIHLSEAQKLNKLESQRKEILSTRRAMQRCRSRELLAKEGIEIDKELSDNLNDILQQKDLSEEQRLFLQEQVRASQLKNMSGMRWHPTMIRVALSVYLASPSAYLTLQESGCVKLPSKRTLFDYTHFKPIKSGIDEVALESIALSVEKFPADYQKYHVLMADEIYISKNLVFQKSSGRLVGFTELDELDREVKSLEAFLDDPNKTIESVEASKILVYMVKGVSNSVKEVVASYPVANFSPQQMYSWTWHLITTLERNGIAIVAFICDGSSTNRSFIKLHEPKTGSISDLVYETVNKAAPHRSLFFISDVAHLLKTIRNCFARSRLQNKKKKKKILQKNGECIVWDTIIKLYNAKKGKNIRKSYKLSPLNVFLNSYSCMKVKLAAQVLSRTVAQDLKDQNWTGISETIKFITTFNDWFDCLNGAHSLQGTKKRNPRLHPYTSISDSRFEFLKSVLNYLDDWKREAYSNQHSVMNMSGFSLLGLEDEDSFNPVEDNDEDDDTPAANKLLSSQTMLGIKMTTLAFIGVCTFLLEEGTKFINGRIFSQDPLEQYFSKQRAGGGGSSNPNVGQFLSKQRSIHVQRQTGVKRGRRGNTETNAAKLEITTEPLPKRKSAFSLKLSRE